MHCPSCQTEIPSHNRFCGHCGAAVALDALPTMTGPPASRPDSSSRSSIEGRLRIGSVLTGRYRILRILGRGGMGEVYHAHDQTLDQEVALKFLSGSRREPSEIDRFRSEVRIARQVSHPNVCRVYDIGEVDGVGFISMEYVDGEDLRSLLRRIGRLPPDKAVEIGRRLCAGIAAAHAVGVLHRDLKPANIMIDTRGQVHIMDFGLADLAESIQDVKSGTPAYMAPEQAEGREVTVRSDIYALGLVLFEIFTGQKPWRDDSERAKTPGANQITPEVDPAVGRVIQRCLETDPRRRPSSALDVARALPGGDPLAEALAAGDTPSPEMVAASDETGLLSVRAAVATLGIVIAGLLALLSLDSGTHVLTLAPALGSSQALEAEARSIAERLGHAGSVTDSGYGYEFEQTLDIWAGRNGIDADDLRTMIARGALSPVSFWYRQSPELLQPVNGRSFLERADPPNISPGMVTLRLDLAGRLLSYLAVPSAQRETTSATVDDLLRLAGLDPSRDCSEALSTGAPPIASTGERTAWSCRYPEAPDVEMHVEASTWDGDPMYFEIQGPWRQESPPGGDAAAANFFFLPLLLAAAWLARFNYRHGRGDFQGAVRLAIFGALTVCLESAFLAHNLFAVAPEGVTPTWIWTFAFGLFAAAMFWVLYVALEPWVRRRWPQSLISWRRLLAGRWRDPVVGGHVLVGVAGGVSLLVVDKLLVPPFLVIPGEPLAQNLGGAGPAIGTVGFLIGGSTGIALFWFLAFFLLRAILRKNWLAAPAIAVIFALMLQAEEPVAPLSLNLTWTAIVVVTAILLVRQYGVLPLVTLVVVFYSVLSAPMVADLTTWYAPATVVALGIVLGLTAGSFYAALGGRPLLREDFLAS